MIERFERANHTLVIDRTGPKPVVYRVPHGKPGVIRKAANFTKAVVNHARAGRPIASDELVAERFAICKLCEFNANGKCQKCGCGVSKLSLKLEWKDSRCPVEKW